MVEDLSDTFDGHLRAEGWLAMGGQIVDVSIMSAPKQRNRRDENEKIKAGETPEDWSRFKRSQKDTDARWIKR